MKKLLYVPVAAMVMVAIAIAFRPRPSAPSGPPSAAPTDRTVPPPGASTKK
jgi:hypothetical protein